VRDRLRRFFVRDDSEYVALVEKYQAKSVASKVFYLFFHLLPGLLVYVIINVLPVHSAALKITGLSDSMLQGSAVLAMFFTWHLIMPFLVLGLADKLSFRESISFLSLHQFDTKGFFIVLPVVFAVFTIGSLPYMNTPFRCSPLG